jgi:AraC-like DNA-binding protein
VRDERAEQARAMRLEGKTLQQIAEALGYKSVSSAHTLLKE